MIITVLIHVFTFKRDEEGLIANLGWVDIIITSSEHILKVNIKEKFKEKLSMKDLRKLTSFLRINFNEDSMITMLQPVYLKTALKQINIESHKPCKTPCELDLTV